MNQSFDLMDKLVDGEGWKQAFQDCSPCKKKITELLAGEKDTEKLELMKKVIQRTQYFPLAEVVKGISEGVEWFIKSVIPKTSKCYIMFLLNDKIGSEHWFTAMMLDKYNLRQYCEGLITRTEDILKCDPGYPILMIDDFTSSGHNIASKVDESSYHWMWKKKTPALHKYYTVVAYGNEMSMQHLKGAFPMLKFICANHLKNELKDEDEMAFHKHLGAEGIPFPVYFEHKIGNPFASYPEIYGAICSNTPSRKKISELTVIVKKWKKEMGIEYGHNPFDNPTMDEVMAIRDMMQSMNVGKSSLYDSGTEDKKSESESSSTDEEVDLSKL